MDNELRIAILIDADNVSDKYIKIIVDEVANIGIATYKRIYGDWTSARLSSWKNVLLEGFYYSHSAVQLYYGKNATDSAMIIDAMDILYSGNVDGYCIVSSDSDFTRLAARLQESGMLVLGMGEEKTPKPLFPHVISSNIWISFTAISRKKRKKKIWKLRRRRKSRKWE